MLLIPSDKYGNDLIESLEENTLSNEDKTCVDLLVRILKLEVVDKYDGEKIYQAKFSEEEIDLIISLFSLDEKYF